MLNKHLKRVTDYLNNKFSISGFKLQFNFRYLCNNRLYYVFNTKDITGMDGTIVCGGYSDLGFDSVFSYEAIECPIVFEGDRFDVYSARILIELTAQIEQDVQTNANECKVSAKYSLDQYVGQLKTINDILCNVDSNEFGFPVTVLPMSLVFADKETAQMAKAIFDRNFGSDDESDPFDNSDEDDDNDYDPFEDRYEDDNDDDEYLDNDSVSDDDLPYGLRFDSGVEYDFNRSPVENYVADFELKGEEASKYANAQAALQVDITTTALCQLHSCKYFCEIFCDIANEIDSDKLLGVIIHDEFYAIDDFLANAADLLTANVWNEDFVVSCYYSERLKSDEDGYTIQTDGLLAFGFKEIIYTKPIADTEELSMWVSIFDEIIDLILNTGFIIHTDTPRAIFTGDRLIHLKNHGECYDIDRIEPLH